MNNLNVISKKIGVLFFFIVLFSSIFFSNFVLAQDLNAIGDQVEKLQDNVDKAQDIAEKSQDQEYWEQKWDYLGKEWKNIVLKNKFVATFDSFFNQFSFVFKILFGVEYSLSLVLLGIMILWFFLFFNLNGIVSATGIIKEEFVWIGTLLINVILAQVDFFKNIIIFLGNLVFAPDYSWTRVIVFISVILAFGAIQYGDRRLAAYIRLTRKKSLERAAEIANKATIEREKAREEISRLGDK